MKISVRQARTRDSSVLPLINIVFLMLIFFLLASSIAPKADLDLNPPQADDGEKTSPPADAVYLSETGLLSVDGSEATFEELPALVAGLARRLGERPLRIVADRGSDGVDLLRTVDAARQAGAADIRLVTLRRRPE